MTLHRSILVFVYCALVLSCRAASTLDIYWVDAEGGAATLIVTPAGETVLIDSGWPTRFPWGGTPPRIKEVLTQQAGAKKIDYLITTHFDIDHFPATPELARLVPIGTVIDNGIPAKELTDGFRDNYPADIQAYKTFKAEKRRIIHAGESIALKQNGPKLELRCLAAQQHFASEPARTRSKTQTNSLCARATKKAPDVGENANSIVLVLTFGKFSFFAGGDLTWNLEEKLVCPVDLVGKIDLYQVTHHGESLSNNPLLIRTIAPTVAVMNCSPRKGASAATFRTLRATPSVKNIFQLHKSAQGGKEHNTEDKFIANLEEKCTGNYIKCSVDRSGKTYTLSIPAKDFAKIYSTSPK